MNPQPVLRLIVCNWSGRRLRDTKFAESGLLGTIMAIMPERAAKIAFQLDF